jgi:hypothetical protein
MFRIFTFKGFKRAAFLIFTFTGLISVITVTVNWILTKFPYIVLHPGIILWPVAFIFLTLWVMLSE